MSKPAGSSGNLEEILASIRQTLAEEADGASTPQKSPADGAMRSAAGAGLSSRIAGVRKAAGAIGGTLDGALAEFFAQISGKDTSPGTQASPQASPQASAQASTQASTQASIQVSTQANTQVSTQANTQVSTQANTQARTGGEPQDPFWFLSRPNGASAAATKDDKPAAASAAPVQEEVKLSRPETLRPSLPPLFVEGHVPAAPARNGVAADGAERQAAAAHASAAVTPGAQPADVAAEAPPLAAPVLATPVSVPEAPPPAERPQGEARAATSPALETAGSAAAVIPGAASPEPAETAVPSQLMAGGIDRNPALEAMIAQLLEPVLVRWLDNNLPRMIDTIVRAEVARALAGRS